MSIRLQTKPTAASTNLFLASDFAAPLPTPEEFNLKLHLAAASMADSWVGAAPEFEASYKAYVSRRTLQRNQGLALNTVEAMNCLHFQFIEKKLPEDPPAVLRALFKHPRFSNSVIDFNEPIMDAVLYYVLKKNDRNLAIRVNAALSTVECPTHKAALWRDYLSIRLDRALEYSAR